MFGPHRPGEWSEEAINTLNNLFNTSTNNLFNTSTNNLLTHIPFFQIIMGRHRNVVEKTLDLMLLVTEKKLVQPEVFEPYVFVPLVYVYMLMTTHIVCVYAWGKHTHTSVVRYV